MADDTYDVFVSYSRADGRHAKEIDSVLRDKGLKTFFDRRNLAAGLPWVRGLEQAIGAARAVIVLIGPRGLGNTQQYERELAFVRQTRDPAFPIVPVILPETTTDPPFDFLRVLTWIDFSHVTRVLDAPGVLQQLLTAIRGGGTVAEGTREAVCPYRGLDAFREEDSAFFFGRGSADDPESAIGQLVRKVREHPFVMVVGRSGSGKSSLVYAGLLPALRREHDRFWHALFLRPGPEPLRALAAAFNPRSGDEGAAEYANRITREADELRTGAPELLSHMTRGQLGQAEGKPDRLLLYIDQWEELYAQAPPSSDKERAAQHAADVNRFIDLLLTAARTAPVAVVATVRADFYDPLIAHQEIKSLLPTRQVLLGSMSRSELERTIVEPAKKVGLVFDPPGLVQRILDEAGEDEGMLPLLQYALKETWARRQGNRLTGDSYAQSGGVREAIRITAERTFDALSPADQQVARQLFLRLVTPGEGQEDTRARAAMPADQAQRKIVEQFASQRTRLLVTGYDRAARPTVEVAHEALIRTWPRLRQWIDSNREKLRSRAAILQAKADWEQNRRRDDMLLPAGLQLERARSLLTDPGDIGTDDIREFILMSSAREEAERKEREEALERDKAQVAEAEWIEALLDAKPPHAARSWLATLRSLCKFAVKRGWLRFNPTADIKLASVKGGGFPTWTDDEIAQFEAHYPIGTKPRLALALLFYTAQRRGDVVRMGRQHIRETPDGPALYVKQRKTGKELLIPIYPELRAVLDATPSEHLTFLVTATGKPYGDNHFSESFREWCDAAGLPNRSAHGLRKARCRWLAEHECSGPEIMANSGHESMKELVRYTKAADQARLARNAMNRSQNLGGNAASTTRQ